MSGVSRSGSPVGFGRSADVYDIGHGRVLRRYRDPARSALYEAEVMKLARAHGVPVPEVFDADRLDIVMEKVDGPTMLADGARHPWRLARYAAVLAGLHAQVHAVPAPDWLRARVGEGAGTGGPVLVHLDLHPDNVLMSAARGPVLIDWERAGRGPAEADLADCWVVLAASEVPGPALQRAVGRAAQRWFADAVLRRSGLRVDAAFMAEAARLRLLERSLLPAEVARLQRIAAQGGLA